MLREKLVTTLLWAAIPIACAMLADYVITVVILHAYDVYTPLVTLCIAVIITLPTTYALVSGRVELRKARDELAAARDLAVNADRTKTQFFANMSHELRTPLNAIIGFSELLALEVFASKREEYAHLIHSSGKHLLSLVNDLLDLSRIEAGKLELADESLTLADLINDCAETVAGRARTRELRLVRNIDPGLPHVVADRRALTQIVLNLLTNAIKFTSPGGSVEVFAQLCPSGEIEVGVRDEGIGIAPEHLARVFERFGQVRHEITGIEAGTGLGLPIVKGLVEAHGGRVAMESEVGHGTCVRLWLPAARVAVPVAVALAS